MAEKSCIIGLPVVPYNQNKISDVCQYLQWLQDLLYKVFKNEVTFTAEFTLILALKQYFTCRFHVKNIFTSTSSRLK